MDLHRFQLILNDACLFHGNLLSTGISTHLFRYEFAVVFFANIPFLMFGNGLPLGVERVIKTENTHTQRKRERVCERSKRCR